MKVPTTRLLLVTEIWDGKPSHRKSLARNLLVWSDLTFGPLLQGQMRTAKLKNVLTYFLHLNNYLVIFLHNTIYRAQLFYPFLLSASEFLSNLLFSYHLLYFCTALFLIIILSSNHLHKSKTLSQLNGHSPLVFPCKSVLVLRSCLYNEFQLLSLDYLIFKTDERN